MSDRYCVIGNPIAHSKSPDIHARFAATTGQDLVYERCLAPLDGFARTVRELVEQGVKGANVTVPFKLDAAAIADELTPRAQAAGAVNTLVFAQGRIQGDNTDGAGLVNDILNNAGTSLRGKRVLLLGAGGAARGAILPLLDQGPALLMIANRTLATAEALVARFGPQARAGQEIACCPFERAVERYDVVINATSASLADDLPPIPPSCMAPGTLAYDMMYGARPTRFMEFAAAQGASTRDGLGMLVEQAAEAFSIWRGVRPATGEVLSALRAQLNAAA